MKADRPTEMAERWFRQASWGAREITNFEQLGHVLADLSEGLVNMSAGIRATYLKLEQLEGEIEQLKRQSDKAKTLARYQSIPPFKK